MDNRHVYVCCSLDVEEEGLFRGNYSIVQPSVTNLSCLCRMQPLMDLGLHATLFCAYPVLADDTAWAHVEALASRSNVEVGLHLHHWNTPPLETPCRAATNAVPSIRVDNDLLAAKLDTLVSQGRRRLGAAPTSFRMGRWDLHSCHWELLARAGICADASVRPLHEGNAKNLGPDHFLAPHTPYLVKTCAGTIFELPLTVTPLASWITATVSRLSKPARASLQKWGVLALLPVYHPLWAMKAVTELSYARGNNVISLTWHSSELMAGGNPRLPKDSDIQALVHKIGKYVVWLRNRFEVEFVTLSELDTRLRAHVPVATCASGDWSYRGKP